MSFIRPEAQAAILRWRETIAGAILVFFGSTLVFGEGGLVAIVGAAIGIGGAVLVFVGLQRGRFRGQRHGGPGSVDVDEGQVTYFGPLTGGAVALRDLDELALIRWRQTPHWRLTSPSEILHIPVDADGAEALFDAFTVLPGIKVQRMLRVLDSYEPGDVVIWSREGMSPELTRH